MTAPLQRSLAHRVFAGAALLVFARLLARLIGLLSTVILARLLIPEDFGLVALGTVFIFVVETVSDLRFDQAIITRSQVTEQDLNTAWTLNVLRGLGLGVLIVIAAYPYALIMSEQRLTGLLLVLALIPILDGLRNPAFVTFEKRLAFRQEFVLQIGQKVVTFVTTVTLAMLFRSYWALAAGIITGRVLRLLASYLMHPYRPRPETSQWRDLLGFSGWLMATYVLRGIIQKLDFLLVGYFLPTRVVGLFHVGFELANMVAVELTAPLRRALLPAFSSLSGDREAQYRAFHQSVEAIAAVSLPLGIGLALIAQPLVLVILGTKWAETAQIMHFLGPASAIWAISGVCDTLILSSGRTRMMFNRELVMVSYTIPALLAGISLFGLHGLLTASIVTAALSLLVNLDMVRRYTAMPMFWPVLATWRSVLSSSVMAGAVLTYLWSTPDGGSTVQLLLHVVSICLIGVTSYVGSHLGLWLASGRPEGFERRVLDLLGMARRRLFGPTDDGPTAD